MIKFIKISSYLSILFLYSCNSFPYNGDINDAHIFHWEHDYVTMNKFIQDHKACLGVKGVKIGAQAQNLFNNMKPRTIPQWDTLWATFESRDYKEAGQRIAFSIPNEGSMDSKDNYRKCMENIGYSLTYKR